MEIFCRTKDNLSRVALATLLFFGSAGDLLGQSDWKKDWERTLQEAKKRGQNRCRYSSAG